MAQVTYTKLNLKPNFDIITPINYAEGVTIEVKQFLPLERKLEVLSNIINNSIDENFGFYNTARIDFHIKMQLVFAYTNIKFTEKQLENTMKIYDTLTASGLLEQIWTIIPEVDREWFEHHVYTSIRSITEYRNSAYGILDAIKTDYSDLDLDIETLRKKLADDKNVGQLKEIVDKMV